MSIICAKIIQNHASASHLIRICLDFYLNKIELELDTSGVLLADKNTATCHCRIALWTFFFHHIIPMVWS